MTNDKRMTKTELPIRGLRVLSRHSPFGFHSGFVIRYSDLIRHLSFVIRHS